MQGKRERIYIKRSLYMSERRAEKYLDSPYYVCILKKKKKKRLYKIKKTILISY